MHSARSRLRSARSVPQIARLSSLLPTFSITARTDFQCPRAKKSRCATAVSARCRWRADVGLTCGMESLTLVLFNIPCDLAMPQELFLYP
jgi:hypothetical protein